MFIRNIWVQKINQSVQFSRSVMSNSLWPHGLQHTRPPCPSPTPGAYSNSCPLSQWCHPTTSSSVIPFSSGPQCWMDYYNCSLGKMKQLSSLWEGLEIKFHTLFWKFFPQVGKMLACLNLDLYEKWVSSKWSIMWMVSEWVKSLSRVWLFATPWTVAHWAPLSMGFSRQEYWSRLPFPSPIRKA